MKVLLQQVHLVAADYPVLAERSTGHKQSPTGGSLVAAVATEPEPGRCSVHFGTIETYVRPEVATRSLRRAAGSKVFCLAAGRPRALPARILGGALAQC